MLFLYISILYIAESNIPPFFIKHTNEIITVGQFFKGLCDLHVLYINISVKKIRNHWWNGECPRTNFWVRQFQAC